MCGRFDLTASSEALVEHFRLRRAVHFQASYNIAPAQKILNIVALEDQSLKAVKLFWGLVPSWAKDGKNSSHLINARMETVREKPSFRSAFKHRRCLIPATGFYEWHKLESAKQAYHIHQRDGQLIAFAGLWEQWQHGADVLYSCTIITTAATGVMQTIHDRMPVIILPAQYHAWLDKEADSDDAYALLQNQAYAQMAAAPVSDWVNNPLHDDLRCLQPVHRRS
ncbi:MAG: SOS response-associated peptidase [Gammaproteobacteria bacterium]